MLYQQRGNQQFLGGYAQQALLLVVVVITPGVEVEFYASRGLLEYMGAIERDSLEYVVPQGVLEYWAKP